MAKRHVRIVMQVNTTTLGVHGQKVIVRTVQLVNLRVLDQSGVQIVQLVNFKVQQAVHHVSMKCGNMWSHPNIEFHPFYGRQNFFPSWPSYLTLILHRVIYKGWLIKNVTCSNLKLSLPKNRMSEEAVLLTARSTHEYYKL